MPQMKHKAYKFRIYPNTEQQVLLARTFGSVRLVYNHYLEAKTKNYEETGKSLSYTKCAADLVSFKKEKPFTIVKDKDVYVIKGDAVEKLFRMTNFNTEEAYERFSNKLRRMGIDEELEKMGIQDGDTVRIFDFEFEWTR